MRRTCQWWTCPSGKEEPCGKPAVASITWPGGRPMRPKTNTYWYCAEHYDIRIKEIQGFGRQDVLELSGVR